jgi:ATP-dependent DNA helicase RecG
MRRLLQGDVGSGKTVVAAMLMALVFRSGASAVLMAPTEIVAKQHEKTLRRFLHGLIPAPLLLLTSSEKRVFEGGRENALQPHAARDRIREGRLILVGTHALLERGMLPPDAALIVIDEQHRFGVAQREALSVARRDDGLVPHFLSMTATPIPRSLALTLYGDLAMSLIREKPEGRAGITTTVVIGQDREFAYAHIRSEAKNGRRAYVVCPQIDESDALGVKSATEEAKRLAKGPLEGLRIALLHGRMSAPDKDGIMKAFRDGLYDVLVATTVVEVGVDVPEATVILIEGAERFGLAQLHQLRGRVGRSVHASACYLATDLDGHAVDRLKVLERTNDGFEVAEEDLKRRGEGNLLGTEQSGLPIFRAGLATDLELMALAKREAEELLRTDPDLASHEALRDRVHTWRMTSHQE